MTKCKGDNCIKQANFGIAGSKATYCLAHKEASMIDVANKKCGC